MKSLVAILAFASLGGWSLYTGCQEPINYERLIWGGLSAWGAVAWIWSIVRSRILRGEGGVIGLVAALVRLVLCIAPGIMLGCYGWFAPASPTYANGGMDICDLEPGYCVSGTRAFIFFGGFAVFWGLLAHWFIGIKPTPPRE